MTIQPIANLLQMNTSSGASAPSQTNGGFGSILSQAMNAVNGTVSNAEQQGIALAAGNATSVASVMESATQAQLAIELTVQVRNRVVSAYNAVMNMQV